MSQIGVVLISVSIAAVANADEAGGGRDDTGSDDHVTLGAGVAVLPDFQGSDHDSVEPVPMVDVKQGRFFARAGDGIGLNVIDMPDFQAGISVAWMRGYDRGDVPEGVGELDSALGGRAFVSGQVGGVAATVSVVSPVFGGDAEGMVVNAQVSYPLELTDRLTVAPSIGTGWADSKYLRRYFGINTEQAAASGLALYRPSSGFKDISARLAVEYMLTDVIGLTGVVLVRHNLDKVMDSPFTERQWEPAGVLALTYTF